MRDFLEQIEKAIQSFFESSIQLLPEEMTKNSIALDIINQISEILLQSAMDNRPAPTHFDILIHPDDLDQEFHSPNWLNEITAAVKEAGINTDFFLNDEIVLILKPDRKITPGKTVIQPIILENELEQTAVIQINPTLQDEEQRQGFLILPNQETFNLSGKMVQIGRKKDNDLILEEATVSRNHAQIRLIRGKYVIFDLGSTGGTLVNGQQIEKSILSPGDIITLSGVTLIYGEEENATTANETTNRLP